MNRIFNVLLWGIIFLLIYSCSHETFARTENEICIKGKDKKIISPESVIQHASEGRAVSLKVLQKMLKDCTVNSTCTNNILHLAGLTKITGYVVDDENRDLILIGNVDEKSPPLYLDDFVVALRNAWLKYAKLKGNTYYYSNPGCSIDPDPKVLSELNEVADKIFSHSRPEAVQDNLHQWNQICRQPQKVRILGIPFNTRFSKVMVEADYFMKRLVDGSVKTGVSGFKSLTDMTLDVIRDDISNNQPVSIPLSTLNRFWFYPDENSYLEDEGIVLIRKSEIKLLTEEEYQTSRGSVLGTGRPNPLAEEFARCFTAKYTDIAAKEHIYSELESLFRIVMITKMMKSGEGMLSAIDLDFLLNRYQVNYIKVNRVLPGIANVKKYTQRNETGRGYMELYFWLPSCGGVSIDISPDKFNINSHQMKKFQQLKMHVLHSRPSPNAISWKFS